MANRNTKLQMVWPKDQPGGFFGRLKDCLTGKGPDILLQNAGSRRPIKVGEWSNWDTYHSPDRPPRNLFGKQRGTKRYDPYTRRYEEWAPYQDWSGDWDGPNPNTGQIDNNFPRFTAKEWQKLDQQMYLTGQLHPERMGSDWEANGFGPKRFRPVYNEFWQKAHRRGRNRFLGTPGGPPDPFFSMHQSFPGQVDEWYADSPNPYGP